MSKEELFVGKKGIFNGYSCELVCWYDNYTELYKDLPMPYVYYLFRSKEEEFDDWTESTYNSWIPKFLEHDIQIYADYKHYFVHKDNIIWNNSESPKSIEVYSGARCCGPCGGDFNPYAQANMSDGRFLCFGCRQTEGWRFSGLLVG